MRSVTTFTCEGATLWATIDDAPGKSGLLIVSGGNEIRIGAHRGMAKLAADVASTGHPVFRFDRRGIGDSEGENSGYSSSGPDIAAALGAFRRACPGLERITAFGNCDAATALAIHSVEGVDRLILANPWVVEQQDDLPPTAAIRAHYAARMRDPKAWLGLVTGAVNFKKLVGGVTRISRPQQKSSLFEMFTKGILHFPGAVSILLAARDGTAIAFADEWSKVENAPLRDRTNLDLQTLDSASHSFASAEDYAALKKSILQALA